MFSRELKAEGVSGEVISLNPDYIDHKLRMQVSQQPLWRGLSVAAIAERLPFRDNCFDVVLGLKSVIDFSRLPMIWGSEVARVLRPGGTAIFSPVLALDKESVKEKYADVIKMWGEKSVRVEIEQLMEKDIGFSKSANKMPLYFRLRLTKL